MTNADTKRAIGNASEDVWIDVDVDSLRSNATVLIKSTREPGSPTPRLMAVVKADGYGHGATLAATAFIEGGADWLAVTTFTEAADLPASLLPKFDAGPDCQDVNGVLIFAPPTDSSQALYAITHGITMTVCDRDHLEIVAKAAACAGQNGRVHLKVDTGMGRLGLSPNASFEVARAIADCPNVTMTGVYTHFAQALAVDLTPTRRALDAFTDCCNRLREAGIDPGIRHAANSAASLRLPESRLDMVRIGTLLYGQYPGPSVPRVDGLSTKTWSMSARAVFVHDVLAGTTVGYGAEYRAKTSRRVAVLPVGFGDGFATAPTSLYHGFRGVKTVLGQILGKGQPYVTFDGHKAPVLGRVAMQMIVVDVTDIPTKVEIGSIATIPMRRIAARSSIPRKSR